MIKYKLVELLHVEADNMIYGQLSSIADILRKGYPGLAAQPLSSNHEGKLLYMTASVLWIANLQSLKDFNTFLLELGMKSKVYEGYNQWMMKHIGEILIPTLIVVL